MAPQNLLLAALPREALDRLAPLSRTVDLAHGEVLQRPGRTIKQVYFPNDCLISITVTMEEGRTAEAGAVGSREMVGLNAFMGGRESTQTEYICQVAGSAVKMPAESLLEEFDQVKAVRDVLLRFTQAYIAFLSQNVACNRIHSIEQRLARWLLETRDRLRRDELALSHEFISQMLGVRRAGATEVIGELRERGLIEYGRKAIQIVNPTGLEKVSCECFRVVQSEFDRLLEPWIRAVPGMV